VPPRNIIAPTLTQKSSYSSSLVSLRHSIRAVSRDAARMCGPSGDKMQMARQNMHISIASTIYKAASVVGLNMQRLLMNSVVNSF
jgi:hypothetical protein